MKTEVIKINDPKECQNELLHAADIIKSGGLVVMPTETVYGLGGNACLDSSAKKIYAAKGRPSDNPLIIHISDPHDAEKYAYTCDIYYKLANAFMPGPLTIVLKKKDIIPYSVTGGLDTVAIRCPQHPVANALIKYCGVPIAAPSANISGKPSPTCATHVIHDLDGKVDMIIDGGECDIGLESTIVSINDDGSLTLLRPGGITYDALMCVCEKIIIPESIEHSLKENERPLSPGMKYKHYAPSSPLILLDGTNEDVETFLKAEEKHEKIAIMCYDEEASLYKNALVLKIGAENDIESHAKTLFSYLRECDDHPEIQKIYAHLPSKDGLGLALYNRMIRAAAHTVKKL